jgi:hypothetical protein
VSRAVVLATAGSSVMVQAMRAARRPMPAYVAAFENLFAFRRPGELVFGVGLLYYFRQAPSMGWSSRRMTQPAERHDTTNTTTSCCGLGCWSGSRDQQSSAAGCWRRQGWPTCYSLPQSMGSGAAVLLGS